MQQYQKVVDLNEVPSGRVRDVLRGVLEILNLEIVHEETPDYSSYEVRPRATVVSSTPAKEV